MGEDRVSLTRVGRLRLWLARAEKEWGYAWYHGEEAGLMDMAQVPEDVVPDELEWHRAFYESAPRDYVFESALPSQPILVRSSAPCVLPAGESVEFTLMVPACLRVTLMAGNRKHKLVSCPSERVEQAWFGTPVKGRLCQLITIPPANGTDLSSARPNQIVVPVRILNRSKKAINLDRIALDLGPAGLFSGALHLWSSPVGLTINESARSVTTTFENQIPKQETELMELKASDGNSSVFDLSEVICSCQPT
jgi:hypothetical protein